MISTSLLKIDVKKMGVASKLTLPRPPIYGRCSFQRLSSIAHSDQLFSKKFFWQCWETYYCKYQIKKTEVVLSKVREFAFVVGWWWWWWWCSCWWFWLNACNIYNFQFFFKKKNIKVGTHIFVNIKSKNQKLFWAKFGNSLLQFDDRLMIA